MPKTVTVFTLGGTISAQSGGGTTRLTGAQTLASAPVPPGVTVELQDVRRLPGSSLTLDDLTDLAKKVDEATAAGHGAVVVQGTDTLEETAFLLDVTCAPREPIVVTGAMRRPDHPGADGPANLAAALATAAAPTCRDLGVLTVLADEIHAARHVRKAHTTSPTTFASPGAGPLGRVVEGVPHILLRPAHPTVERPLRLRTPARVALLTLTLGDQGELLEAVDDRFDGLVVAAFGAGHVPKWLVEPLTAVAARIPVVLASRTGAGPLLSETYNGPGSESDLLARGLISAGHLDGPKARILLYALLADGADRATTAAAFDRLRAG
ncbi:asparaginase [Streptomyces lasiicapitis]|uniref:L-asparaginase n=1 Tax=Streptomyces lasiicapitis TaxID=1923961 RepID=A0ABQ2LZY1_9ACTN|nr:asparaginase [Streptomyces lasiicapitis]GGO45077.1 L-asparaginase [Streptomyces lasiicapitis]